MIKEALDNLEVCAVQSIVITPKADGHTLNACLREAVFVAIEAEKKVELIHNAHRYMVDPVDIIKRIIQHNTTLAPTDEMEGE